MNKWGFLRETEEDAKRAGIDKATGLHRTGLEKYLEVIFPGRVFIHNEKFIPKRKIAPDYRCEEEKLIVEFDGLPHYKYVNSIKNDLENTQVYESLGYKVVRIPYFIQLSNDAVFELFGVHVKELLFDESIPSMSSAEECSPAYMCGAGVERMAKEFKRFPNQYRINLEALEKEDDEILSGANLLKAAYEKL